MKIAVPIWDGNISPVLDTAEKLMMFDVVEGKVISQYEIYIGGMSIQEKARVITDNARIMICGALSNHMATVLSLSGLILYPWVMGNVDRLVEIIAVGNTPGPEFSMPGCRRKRCRSRAGGKHNGLPHMG